MTNKRETTLGLFYCQNVPVSSEQERQNLELKYGQRIRLFPIPCSGRLEPLHLLRALEEFADMAYVITCPEGACRYFEGNYRARKRVQRTQAIISSIGLEVDRVGIIVGSKDAPKALGELVDDILKRTSGLGPSPVHKKV
jgi:coenzyme F420-reducing hydrogenase delta subunit